MDEFKLGDVVYLKSGSPPLTIAYSIKNSDQFYVRWLDGDMKEAVIDKVCLTRFKPSVEIWNNWIEGINNLPSGTCDDIEDDTVENSEAYSYVS